MYWYVNDSIHKLKIFQYASATFVVLFLNDNIL